MTIPDSIPFSSVRLSESRARTVYPAIPELANAIEDEGLIQPIVLVALDDGTYEVDAGGRRFRALELLSTETLYHATTSEPGRPGFVIKGPDQSTPLERLLTEFGENRNRHDLDWRDELNLIVKAYKLASAEANKRGVEILQRDLGTMLGVPRCEVMSALAVHDEMLANPEKFKDCVSIRGAYTKTLKQVGTAVAAVMATKSVLKDAVLRRAATPPVEKFPPVEDQNAPRQSEISVPLPEPPMEELPVHTIPLSQQFLNCNSLDFMEDQPPAWCDHICCDPDYAVSVERLESNSSSAGSGVIQSSVEDSLADLYRFLPLAFRALKDQGFLIFWYDLDHHEKLQRAASAAGFAVQRWPLIWKKVDYRSNAAPSFNFTKNMEYAMVCRKPGATLIRAQTSSIYEAAGIPVVKQLGHPFSKPLPIWKWIYSAIAVKGQIIFDPFAGAGSSAVAAIEVGLRPLGCELNPDHYTNLLLNLQETYRRTFAGPVRFV